jgi:hypothetical protein
LSVDPPDRGGVPKNVLWIILSCLIALAFIIPIGGIVSAELASRERITELRAPSPPPLSYNDPAGMERDMRAQANAVSRQFEATTSSLFGFLGLTLIVQGFLAIIGLMLFAFWLWMLVTVVTTEPEGSDKIVWTLVVVFTGPIGAAIYLFARHIKRGRASYSA